MLMLQRLISLFIFAGLALPVTAQDADCPQNFRYTFSWSQAQGCDFNPRGGTSTGTPVTLDPNPHPGWVSLQEKGLSNKEKDRRAILAMAGPYRTSFEFLETVAYTPAFERGRPYQSWGTEYIYVVEDSADLIRLQHIIVMFVKGEDGEVMGPFVQKHWRQDWAYEPTSVFAYVGNDTWAHQQLPAGQSAGSWAQSVYQVDDSPRYESWGRWDHRENFSSWISNETWRPLPRRESSVRDDYQVLIGSNRHTIVPTGWVHEEENYKVVLDESGAITDGMPYVSKELGVNRYERIIDFDFSAGDEYWQLTSRYWEDARAVWQAMFDSAQSHTILDNVDGVPLFAVLFEQAEEMSAAEGYDSVATREIIRSVLEDYFQ
jgi:hypothetical protein